jgi:hypothetical protein
MEVIGDLLIVIGATSATYLATENRYAALVVFMFMSILIVIEYLLRDLRDQGRAP